MRFLQKFKNIFGYHILEFTVLLVVVMAAIITMGPYVLRSVNANFKGWDDSTRDSVDDPLFLAADNTPIPSCLCGTFGSVGCGLSSCSEVQQLFERTCLPIGCEDDQPGSPVPLENCIEDICCCTSPQPMYQCGVLGGSELGDRPICSTPESNEVSLNVDGTCPDGYMKSSIQCGDETFDRYVCIQDSVCVFQCMPPLTEIGGTHQQLCIGSNERLTSDVNYTAVGSCTGGKCQVACKSPFVPGGGNCVCPSSRPCHRGDHCCGVPDAYGNCVAPFSCP